MTLISELTAEETERLEELAQKQGEDIAQVVGDAEPAQDLEVWVCKVREEVCGPDGSRV